MLYNKTKNINKENKNEKQKNENTHGVSVFFGTRYNPFGPHMGQKSDENDRETSLKVIVQSTAQTELPSPTKG